MELRRSSEHRWRTQGWDTFVQAEAAYREIITQALAAGLSPGDPLPPAYRPCMDWLVEGLTPRQLNVPRNSIAHFTFYGTGRDHPTGQFGFAAVDHIGVQHPFSLRGALTGFDMPRYKPDPNSPFFGVTT